MEREIQRFFTLSLEEGNVDHRPDPFAIPDDMDARLSTHLGSHIPSLPSPDELAHRTMWNMPPQLEHESFFEVVYESIMQARENPPESKNLETELQLQLEQDPEPAHITAPFQRGITLPPRFTTPFPLTDPEIPPTIYSEALQHNLKLSAAQSFQTRLEYCIQPSCPIAPLRHHQGRYIHNDVPATNYLPTFGTSNPPPIVWQAIHNGCLGVGTQEDADTISRFLTYHVSLCNFSVVPESNFVWGGELHDGGLEGRPLVRLPFWVTPLRVRFDAEGNLGGGDRRGGSEETEWEEGERVGDEDVGRERARRLVLGRQGKIVEYGMNL
ncbi:MAG: hypothetical protein Q9204_005587 [Flavoplaca sp. TL-2023a]